MDSISGRPRQVQRTVEARTSTEAQARVAELQRDVATGKVSRSTATVDELLAEYVRHLGSRGRVPTTIHEAERIRKKGLVRSSDTYGSGI